MRISRLLAAPLALAAALLDPHTARAADNIETTGTDEKIYERFWVPEAFPIRWHLHRAGVVNNHNIVGGTADVSNADAIAQLETSLTQWTTLGSSITFAFDGETATGTSAIDGENVVTWSDQADFSNATTIARGIATSYVGAPAAVNDATRSTLVPGLTLSAAVYPNGSVLLPGTIVDMDLSFNGANFDFETVPASVQKVADIQAIAVHEFGHGLGLSHSSLFAPDTGTQPTMFPQTSTGSAIAETNQRSIEFDDIVAISRLYPGDGFWPTGSAPFTTGAISGEVLQSDGSAVEGIRVWAWNVSDTTRPVIETFTASAIDGDAGVAAGSFLLPGLPPGEYFVAIQQWGNDTPSTFAATATKYNRTTARAANAALAFNSEAYDDIVSAGSGMPGLAGALRVRVHEGATSGHVDFVLGAQPLDVVLVMDKSGSMNLPSGHPGVSKLDALKSAANEFIDFLSLDHGHRLGLVRFDETVTPGTPPFDLQALTAPARDSAHASIGALTSGGFTNIIAGVQAAIDQLGAIASPNPRQAIVLFTDGRHNRPAGTSVASIHDSVVDNDVRFHSIGFGTDVDDAVLSNVALDSGGTHVNEQDLDPLSLQKHFVTVAASAADTSLLIDPRFELKAGGMASIQVEVGAADKSVTFAAHWLSGDAKGIEVAVTGPDGRTRVPDGSAGVGFERRRGGAYELVRVQMPFTSGVRRAAQGTWTLTVKSKSAATVDLLAFGSGGPRLIVTVDRSNPLAPALNAKVVRAGKPLLDARLSAEIYFSKAPFHDSTQADQNGNQPRPPGVTPIVSPAAGSSQRRPVARLQLEPWKPADAGRGAAGVFTAQLPLREAGVYQWRVIAEFLEGKRKQRREAIGGVTLKPR